jgi:hypothetical protein
MNRRVLVPVAAAPAAAAVGDDYGGRIVIGDS